MIIDYLDSSAPDHIDTDLCIIGAGAAGIAIARHFIGTAINVCLVEGGGMTSEESSQNLYDGTSIGHPAHDAGASRLRTFGGSCNLWGGGCIPLDAEDLAPRDWVPHSGWPIFPTDLAPYYERAQRYCQIDAHEIHEGAIATPLTRAPLAFDADKLVNKVFARSPIVFGQAYRSELEDSEQIKLVLHANLLELEAHPDGQSIRQARIAALSGRTGWIRARHYVLACGGIENARQLLLSNSIVPQGLGNRADQVGRYFMDHPSGRMGIVSAGAPDRLTRPYDRRLGNGPSPAFPEIALSHALQRASRLLSGRVHPFPIEGPVPPGMVALRDFRRRLRTRVDSEASRLEARIEAATCNARRVSMPAETTSAGIAAQLFGIARGAGDIARAAMHKLGDRSVVNTRHVELVGYFEQSPNPDSRITLSDDVDALGQRKVRIDWRLTPLDLHTYKTASTIFGNELAQACGGQFKRDAWLDELADDSIGACAQVHGTAHHLGTTRMSRDPSDGVVDPHGKVHGIDNLHIAGSSVFPTGGWAFPTFTIVALSLRLAERLDQRLKATTRAA